jgi:predicted double-glycine peptidase
MKVPLRYQMTKYECGTASLLNAIAYLYDREETPVELLKTIFNYTIDDFGSDGRLGDGGTSSEALMLVTHHLNNYAKETGFNIKAEFFSRSDVNERLFQKHLKSGTVAVVWVWQTNGHYVLVNKIDDNKVYIFDSWYMMGDKYDKDDEVEIVPDNLQKYNRVVSQNRFFSHGNADFAQGKFEKREVLFISME